MALSKEEYEQLSPMMRHYMDTKKEYPDCILFYRLGDFYEMFFEDAQAASKALEITLTGKECGLKERAPMCGVPFHAVDAYLPRLIQKGYKVAIAEQMEDPKLAKGLVKREVIRVVTPGTITSEGVLDEAKNNYLMGIFFIDGCYGISVCDLSTGEFLATQVKSRREVFDEAAKFDPSELIVSNTVVLSGIDLKELKERTGAPFGVLEKRYFDEENCRQALKGHFKVAGLKGLGLEEYPAALIAAGAVLQYLVETQKSGLEHIGTIQVYATNQFMVIDTSTRRNLELTETLREKQKKGTLLWVLDKTKTAMGARLLRAWLEQPLICKDEILKRQDAIEELNLSYICREELREYLNSVYDMERLIGRISYKTANPRDLIAFLTSIRMLPHIKKLLGELSGALLVQINERLDALDDLCDLVGRAIVDDPPVSVREGGIIKEGFNEEADTLRKASTQGKGWLAALEQKERESTGIKNLRIKFNRVFGYYFEVTNSFKSQVPAHFIRRQTLTNAERYTSEELKKLEEVIMGAEDRLVSLEYDLFCQVRDAVGGEVKRIQESAKAIACLDVLCSLSVVAMRRGYVRPKINEKGLIHIREGRHPVVEAMMPGGQFVANDTTLDTKKNRLLILTGPNMAGKSTYMRQVALIVLMAQLGSFVPAASADIGICDRIFTRVGASDDLASGQSTFMVEMTEVAGILRNATKNSLLVLDEIGRGTSTFDGLSIAWAVIEYISNTKRLGAKTLFATHYHELTELEESLAGVKNYCIAVTEQGDDIVFLRKIVRGGADKSYGIQVARLAGVPDAVIERAKEIAQQLNENEISNQARVAARLTKPSMSRKRVEKPDEVDMHQLSFFETVQGEDIAREIEGLELSAMTPIDALNTLYRLQTKLKNRWKEEKT